MAEKPAWLDQAAAKVKEEREKGRKEWMDEKGIQPPLKLVVGQNLISIDATRDPVKVDTSNGESIVFHLTQPLGVDLWASEYLYQEVVSFLDDCVERGVDVSNPIPCKITRTGTGKNDTRYSIDLV